MEWFTWMNSTSKQPQLHGVARLGDIQLGLADEAVLAQLALDEAHREPRGVHRQIDALEQVSQRADVVLMAVRDDNAADTAALRSTNVKSGRTRSTPSISPSGKAMPQSTITISSPHS